MAYSSRFTYVDEAGDSLDLDDGSTYQVIALPARGLPRLDVRAERQVGRIGGRLKSASVPMRQITLALLVRGTSLSDVEDNVQALIAHCAGSYGREEPREGVLTYTLRDASARALRGIFVGGMEASAGQRAGPWAWRFPLTFLAPHGNWYNATEQSETGTIGPAGALEFPIEFPISFGVGVPSVFITITNNGSAETESLQWEAPGPSTAPQLHTSELVRSVRFPNLTVPTGNTLKVRMGWRPDGITAFQAYLENEATGSQTNVIGYLEEASRRFWLEPGSNELLAAQDNDDATVHTVKWHDEYLGV